MNRPNNGTHARDGVDPELRIDAVKRGKSLDLKLPVPKQATEPPPSSSTSDRERLEDVSSDEDQAELDDRSDYIPRWARSSKSKNYGDDDDPERQEESSIDAIDDDNVALIDDLPSFADEASKALYREIKLLERQRDEAARLDGSNKERLSIINDHLRSIRQEIDHTNSLVAAKKSEVSTEEHLLSLSQRELGQTLRDISAIESGNLATLNNINSMRSQIKTAEDELEKLKTDLNWNQEELEQWATAATKKEAESLALQKYALSDELKIKELTLTIEDLTKLSVEKKALLENEVTETKANQSELEKLAERFKSRHDERRQLLQQWKDTIKSMNDRDEAINALAEQYAGLAQKEDNLKNALYTNKDQYLHLENERDGVQNDIDYKERLLQTKRQELSLLQESENSLKDEAGSLRRENAMVVASVENRRAEKKRAQNGLEDKQERVGVLTKQLDDIKDKLRNEKVDTSSEEQRAESIEKSVANREKELQQAEKNISELKKNMYKESQRLADLRKKETDLIAKIRGTQTSIKNFTSKASELENKRARHEELLDNANFKLQQMETKIARGLGERSNEEQKKLNARIEALKKELESERQNKLVLIQQQRKLQTELRSLSKKCESTESKYNETVLMCDAAELEICACEQSLREIVAKKEEAMVSHDVTLLEVRRLRDSLRDLLEEIYSLIEHAETSASSMQEKKEQIIRTNEGKIAQLRASKDERHKSAIALGKLKIVLDKTKAKYDMVSVVNAKKGEGEGFESPELKLILAAQRREELQQEGDKLDESIQKKEKEIKSLEKTLMRLKELNTNFRSSFSRADTSGANAQKLLELENKVQVTEDTLVRVRKELQVLQKSLTEDKSKLDHMMGQIASNEKRNSELRLAKTHFEDEANAAKGTLDEYSVKVSAYQSLSHQSRWELQYKKFYVELLSLQADRIMQLLINLGEEFPDLRDDILTDMKRMGV
ncbi:hypothetical protein ACHAXA_010574 [Cyclostephanos tholiformis]|uniref:Coiled-coil domain-containing protein 39 n=1 Tax=Cyclostephanos tholiformis TaxID=382380 RepID=A0ABD3RZD8_9STRA